MILPIYVYGSKVLQEQAVNLTPDYPELSVLIENMFETMYGADGIGLAAPQVGVGVNLFVIDVSGFFEGDDPEVVEDGFCGAPFRRVFINAEILDSSDDLFPYTEGCLSVPGVNASVNRPGWIEVRYFDEDFVEHTCRFSGILARVIQHEMDHLSGRVFVERVSSLRRQMLRSKLQSIVRGEYRASYRSVLR